MGCLGRSGGVEVGLALIELFWLVQPPGAVCLLEAIDHTEHDGLQRRILQGRASPWPSSTPDTPITH